MNTTNEMNHEDGRDPDIDAGIMLSLAKDLSTQSELSPDALSDIKETLEILNGIMNA